MVWIPEKWYFIPRFFITGFLPGIWIQTSVFFYFCNYLRAQLDLKTKFQQLKITQLIRISKSLKDTVYENFEGERVRAVNNGIEKNYFIWDNLLLIRDISLKIGMVVALEKLEDHMHGFLRGTIHKYCHFRKNKK